jgi:hypothetical protein
MTTGLPFATVDDVEPGLLEETLRASSAMTRGHLTAVAAEAVGTGQMADSYRLTLTYDGDTDGPASVVAKFAASDELSRATGRNLRIYEVEAGFYRELAPTVGARVPRCHLAAHDPGTHDSTLVFEDLSPAVQGDQLAGCGADLADLVLEQAAAYQTPRWDDPALARIGWLDRSTPEQSAATGEMVAALYPAFLERYGDHLDADLTAAAGRAMAHAGSWWRGRRGPRTLVHGDLRLDNLLIGTEPHELWIVDWQTLALGSGMIDVSYFLGGNLHADERRRVEEDLVRGHHARLVAAGVEGYGWDRCWEDHRRGTWHGVFMAVGASMLVARTERGDRMFTTDFARHVQHTVDLDAFDLLEDRGD